MGWRRDVRETVCAFGCAGFLFLWAGLALYCRSPLVLCGLPPAAGVLFLLLVHAWSRLRPNGRQAAKPESRRSARALTDAENSHQAQSTSCNDEMPPPSRTSFRSSRT